MDEEDAELRNPFPSPPSHYTNYTSHNLKLLGLLRERAGPQSNLSQVNQLDVLQDQTDVPDWPLHQLEKPRVDWVLEEGQYNVFGDTWFVREIIPSLLEQGGQQFYPSDPSVDRRPALLTVLRSLLVSYSRLLDALLLPPPTVTSGHPPEWRKHVEWITVMAQNIMAAANDLRPIQARANIEMMMHRQVEVRKEETRVIHEKCDALEAKLGAIRTSVEKYHDGVETLVPSSSAIIKPPLATRLGGAVDIQPPTTTSEDVLRWAEELSSTARAVRSLLWWSALLNKIDSQ